MIKIDFHTHSSRSYDSNMSFYAIIKAAEAKGLDGIVILDHNIVSGIEDLNDAIKNYYGKTQKDKQLIIIRAGEYSTEEGHIVVLGLTEPIESKLVMSNGKYSSREVVELSKQQGAVVILAHPFRWKSKQISPWLTSQLDAIEVYNSRNCFVRRNFNANQKAAEWAKELNLPIVGGSDAHFLFEIGKSYVCFDVEKKDFDFKKLKTYNAVVYGNYSHPMFEVASQLLKAFRRKNVKSIPRLFPKIIYGSAFYIIAFFFPKRFLRGKISEFVALD